MPPTRTRIIRIGNSQGIRIPRALLEQAGLETPGRATVGREVELAVERDGILLRPAHKARAGWAEAFARMAECGDDRLLDDVQGLSSWDEQEWEG